MENISSTEEGTELGISSTEAREDGTQLFNTMCMHLDDLDKTDII
jgi:hypothetical protein